MVYDGLVNMNYRALGTTLVRPVSFDGMLSPLWVQRAPDKPAATGGGAEEALNEKAVRLSGLTSMQAYIVTKGMSDTLKKSPSVNDYAADLNNVAKGTDAFAPVLGAEQSKIVRAARAARGKADAEFAGLPATAVPVASAANCLRRVVSRAGLTMPSGRSDYASVDTLAHEMEIWAAGGFVENRGQRFPAERFAREAAQSPEAAQAIVAAATALLRKSDDADVLDMVAQLGVETTYRPYYVALVERLAGKPTALPDGLGIRSLTVKGDLLMRLEDRLPSQDEALARRIAALPLAARTAPGSRFAAR